jgi:hypothetical protein
VQLLIGGARGRPERTQSVRAAQSARAIAQRSRTRGANA